MTPVPLALRWTPPKEPVKVITPAPTQKAIVATRQETLETLRAARKPLPEQDIKSWPYRYAARRIAWHVLDHAWEMEDRSEA